MRLSQWIALIEEEFPRIKEYKDNIPKETIRMFVIETRKDLKDFDEAMHHVETTTLWEIPDEYIAKWFEGEEEITDEDLEEQFWKVIFNSNNCIGLCTRFWNGRSWTVWFYTEQAESKH